MLEEKVNMLGLDCPIHYMQIFIIFYEASTKLAVCKKLSNFDKAKSHYYLNSQSKITVSITLLNQGVSTVII